MKKAPFLWMIVLFALFGCEKEKEAPAPTGDLFECKVNGVLWKPEVYPNWHGLVALSSSNGPGGFRILANKAPDGEAFHQSIGLYSYGPVTSDTLHLGDPIVWPSGDFERPMGKFMDLYANCNIDTDSFNTGFIHLVCYDPNLKRLRGTFEFTVNDPDCGTFHITEGRFDVSNLGY